jgi:hypothetical protein
MGTFSHYIISSERKIERKIKKENVKSSGAER